MPLPGQKRTREMRAQDYQDKLIIDLRTDQELESHVLEAGAHLQNAGQKGKVLHPEKEAPRLGQEAPCLAEGPLLPEREALLPGEGAPLLGVEVLLQEDAAHHRGDAAHHRGDAACHLDVDLPHLGDAAHHLGEKAPHLEGEACLPGVFDTAAPHLGDGPGHHGDAAPALKEGPDLGNLKWNFLLSMNTSCI